MVVVVVVLLVVVVMMAAVLYERFAVGSKEDILLEEKVSLRICLFGKLQVGFHHVFMGAIDVEVVGVGGCDDGHVGMQLEERAVVLVSLDNNIFAVVVNQQVAVEVLADTSEESAAAAGSTGKEVGNHGGGGGLPVASGNSYATLAACHLAEYL